MESVRRKGEGSWLEERIKKADRDLTTKSIVSGRFALESINGSWIKYAGTKTVVIELGTFFTKQQWHCTKARPRQRMWGDS